MDLRLDRYHSLLLLSGAMWGTAYVAIKIGLTEGDPYLFGLLRFVLGSAVLLVVIFFLKRFDLQVLKDRNLWWVGLLNALCIALQNVGMTMTTATNAVLLFNMCVGFVAIFAAIILDERPARRVLLGIGVGMAGVLLVSTNGDVSAIYSGTFQGNLLILLSGMMWALCTVYLKRTVDSRKDTLMVTAGMFLVSAVFLAPLTLAFTADYAMGDLAWASVIWTGVVCTGAAFLAYNIGLSRVSVTSATVIMLSEVVFTMVFALLLLAEMPTTFVALGGLMVIISVLIIALPSGTSPKDLPVDKKAGPPSA